MPIYNVTIDDASPMFTYSNQWRDTDRSDLAFVRYANSTFHATQTPGATATFSFTGTAVYIYGAKRPNHDTYTVTLDNVSDSFNGFGQDLFQQLLFSASGLENERHDITITDQPIQSAAPWFDLDFVTLTIGDDDSTTGSLNQTMDDTSPNITYSNWNLNTGTYNSTFYHNDTFHFTNTFNATASIPFFGSIVYVYGSTLNTHGLYNVSIDGAPPETLNGNIVSLQNATIFRPKNLIYFASGLSDTNHELVLTNIGTNGGILDLDQIVSTTWTPSSPIPSAGSTPVTTIPHPRVLNIPAIAGATAAGITVIIFLVISAFVLRHRRRRNAMPPINAVIPFPPENDVIYSFYHRSEPPTPWDNPASPFSDTHESPELLSPPAYRKMPLNIDTSRGHSPTTSLPSICITPSSGTTRITSKQAASAI